MEFATNFYPSGWRYQNEIVHADWKGLIIAKPRLEVRIELQNNEIGPK